MIDVRVNKLRTTMNVTRSSHYGDHEDNMYDFWWYKQIVQCDHCLFKNVISIKN